MESFDDEVAAAWETIRKKNLKVAAEKGIDKEKPGNRKSWTLDGRPAGGLQAEKGEKTEKKEAEGGTLEEAVQEVPQARSIIPEAQNFFANKPNESQNLPKQTAKEERPKQAETPKDVYSRKPEAAEEKNYAPMASASSEQGFKLAAKAFQINNPLESSFNIRPVQNLINESKMPEKRTSEIQELKMHYESPEEKFRQSEKKYKLFK